jgi:hypothetical protein
MNKLTYLVEPLYYKAEGRGFDFRRGLRIFSIDVIPPVVLWLWGELSL